MTQIKIQNLKSVIGGDKSSDQSGENKDVKLSIKSHIVLGEEENEDNLMVQSRQSIEGGNLILGRSKNSLRDNISSRISSDTVTYILSVIVLYTRSHERNSSGLLVDGMSGETQYYSYVN